MFTVTDLFSGCGGFSYGFKEKGFKIKYAIDINSQFLQTFISLFLHKFKCFVKCYLRPSLYVAYVASVSIPF